MAARRASHAGVAACGALALLLAACTAPEVNEVSLAACTDPEELDEDDDGAANCKDPDCYGFLACQLEGRLLLDGSVRPGVDAGDSMDGDGGSGDGGQAGEDGGDPPPANDGGTLDASTPEDASTPPDPCSSCAADETCSANGCIPIDSSTLRFELTIESATVPFNDATTRCYDCEPLYAACGACRPDPYVIVYIVPNNRPDDDGTEVARTPAVTENVSPTFGSTFSFALAPGDMLRFEVWDADDAPDTDDELYSCLAESLVLDAPSTIDCRTLAGFVDIEPFYVLAALTPITE